MRAVGLVLFALTVAASTLADEDYAIRLARPRKVGQRYRIESKGERRVRQKLTVGEELAKDDDKKVSVQLVAVATVLAVDAGSSARRVEYRVESCQRLSDGKAAEVVLPAGTRVTAESKNAETHFTIDGDPSPTPETLEALKAVISIPPPNSPTDDAIFGTRERKHVGDQWSIDSAASARSLSNTGFSVAPEDDSGTVRLEGVRMIDGVQALEISAHFQAENMKIAVPKGMRLESASIRGDFSSFVPVDSRRLNYLPESVRMEGKALMTSQVPDTGEKAALEVSMEVAFEIHYSELPGIADSPSKRRSPHSDPKTRSRVKP